MEKRFFFYTRKLLLSFMIVIILVLVCLITLSFFFTTTESIEFEARLVSKSETINMKYEHHLIILVPETEVKHLKEGMKARIFITALPYIEYEIFEGEFSRLYGKPIPYPDSPLSYYQGVVKFKHPEKIEKYYNEGALKTGMTARVKIITDEDMVFKLIIKKFFKKVKI